MRLALTILRDGFYMGCDRARVAGGHGGAHVGDDDQLPRPQQDLLLPGRRGLGDGEGGVHRFVSRLASRGESHLLATPIL